MDVVECDISPKMLLSRGEGLDQRREVLIFGHSRVFLVKRKFQWSTSMTERRSPGRPPGRNFPNDVRVPAA